VDRRASGDGYAGLSEPSLVLYRRRKLSEELFNDNYFSPSREPNNRRRTRRSQYQELTHLRSAPFSEKSRPHQQVAG
jgi:hypothetical protein